MAAKREPSLRLVQSTLTSIWQGRRRWQYTNIDEKKIWSWNANGLRNKADWLRTAIDKETEAPAVILV